MMLSVALHGPDGAELDGFADYQRAVGGFKRDGDAWVNATRLAFGVPLATWPPITAVSLVDQDGVELSRASLTTPIVAEVLGPPHYVFVSPEFAPYALRWIP